MTAWINLSQNKKTCFVFYYSGHGGIHSGYTEAVLNKEPSTRNSTFPIEAKLRKLAEVKGLFVIGLLDCCRTKLNTNRGIKQPPAPGNINCVITFACPPYETTKADCHLSEEWL